MKDRAGKHRPLIKAIASGDLRRIDCIKKEAYGKRATLKTFYDALKFFSCVDENGDYIDRPDEVEIDLQEPFKSAMENILNNQQFNKSPKQP